MIGDIEAGRVNCVVVKDLSRFGRDYIESGRYIQKTFPALGVRLYPARQGIYTLSPETALLLRNKSTAKGVIYYGSFQSGTEITYKQENICDKYCLLLVFVLLQLTIILIL